MNLCPRVELMVHVVTRNPSFREEDNEVDLFPEGKKTDPATTPTNLVGGGNEGCE